jgi:hypothetical protein
LQTIRDVGGPAIEERIAKRFLDIAVEGSTVT